MPVLTRAWQLLLKGMQEVEDSPRPLAAADMILSGSLTPPICRRRTKRCGGLSTGGAAPRPRRLEVFFGAVSRALGARMSAARRDRSMPSARPMPATEARLSSFEDVIALAAKNRDIQLKLALERDVRVVRFEDGSIEISSEFARLAAARAKSHAPSAGMDGPALDRRDLEQRRRAKRSRAARERRPQRRAEA